MAERHTSRNRPLVWATLSTILMLLPVTPVLAADTRSGKIDEVNANERSVIIDDRQYALGPGVSLKELRKGQTIRFKFETGADSRRFITEVVPQDR